MATADCIKLKIPEWDEKDAQLTKRQYLHPNDTASTHTTTTTSLLLLILLLMVPKIRLLLLILLQLRLLLLLLLPVLLLLLLPLKVRTLRKGFWAITSVQEDASAMLQGLLMVLS